MIGTLIDDLDAFIERYYIEIGFDNSTSSLQRIAIGSLLRLPVSYKDSIGLSHRPNLSRVEVGPVSMSMRYER
jgi:hypothetical protein